MNHIYIFTTLFLTIYGQIVIKWQVNKYGALPDSFGEKIVFLLKFLLNPWVISSLVAAVLAALAWIAAMTKFELSYAYPFMSLAFLFVLVLSSLFFNEAISFNKVVGVIFIMAGIVIGSHG